MVQKNSLSNFAIVICGSTGSGKSQLAIDLAKALNTEIISADSISIYKKLNIGTAKPTVSEQLEIKHHMIDICNPTEEFTVSDYEKLAFPVLSKIISDKKIPIICGGTGFYINSLLFSLSYGGCSKNEDIRSKYERILTEKGPDCLYQLLCDCDSETAEKLHCNDTVRVIRALEIFEVSGKKKSQIKDSLKPKIPFFAFSFDFERSVLYERINNRVDKMFEMGLYDEVLQLQNSGLNANHQSMQGIGYKEFFLYQNSALHIDKIKALIQQNSRRYAKRQITFFKKLEGLTYLRSKNAVDATQEILRIINHAI